MGKVPIIDAGLPAVTHIGMVRMFSPAVLPVCFFCSCMRHAVFGVLNQLLLSRIPTWGWETCEQVVTARLSMFAHGMRLFLLTSVRI